VRVVVRLWRCNRDKNDCQQMSVGVAAVISMVCSAVVRLIAVAEQIEGNRVMTHHRFGMSVPSERQPAEKRAEQEEVEQNSFHKCFLT